MKELESYLKLKSRSHNYNERVDAYVMLTHMAETAKNNEKEINILAYRLN